MHLCQRWDVAIGYMGECWFANGVCIFERVGMAACLACVSACTTWAHATQNKQLSNCCLAAVKPQCRCLMPVPCSGSPAHRNLATAGTAKHHMWLRGWASTAHFPPTPLLFKMRMQPGLESYFICHIVSEPSTSLQSQTRLRGVEVGGLQANHGIPCSLLLTVPQTVRKQSSCSLF